MFEELGITERTETIYRALLSGSGCTVPEVARRLGRSQRAVRHGVTELEQLGLVNRALESPVRLLAVRPDTAVDLLVARRKDELDRMRAQARAVAAELESDAHRPDELVEIVVGEQAVGARFAQLVRSCRRELQVFDRPPYASQLDESEADVMSVLHANVQVRGIYAPESLERPGALAAARRAVHNGERSKVHPRVPMKLAIADSERALLPLVLDDTATRALLIRHSALLDALVVLFELLWQQATPLIEHEDTTASAGTGSSDEDLLTLLAAGLKDESIARQLQTSPRTVTRRVARVLDSLGARTRFQAGALAQRRGWLPG